MVFYFKTIYMFSFVVVIQNDIIEWVRDHRVHHKFSETDADPHNAKRGLAKTHFKVYIYNMYI